MCCYRDIKNFERFQLVVQSMICLSIVQLKNIDKLVVEHNHKISSHQSSSSSSATTAQTSSSTAATSSSQNASVATVADSKCVKNESLTTSKPTPTDNNSSDASTNQSELEKCSDPPNVNVENKESNSSSNSGDKIAKNISVSKNESNESDADVNSPTKSANIADCIEERIENAPTNNNQTNDEKTVQSSKKGEHNDDNSANETKNNNAIAVRIDEQWTLAEFERLLILLAKAFLLNFPLYIAYKHAVHARLDDISPQDAQNLSIYCDLHENEMPIYLLRNVSLFCTAQGFVHLNDCFDVLSLPVSTAHAITAVVSNLKLWLNYRSIVTLFVPIRSKILQYMCKLADQDLRSPATKSMADFMWTSIKDPLDTQITFDTDGLALAFKYFTSTTLTMRLAGMAQINAHINLFNDICTSETVAEVEMVGQKLSDWLIENKIINHLFGPNLHVEVIKQSPIVLRFLAVENQITEEHLNLIWQAAQLKHCSKAIYDVLPPLVKNLSLQPALHMYSLLCHLDPKEHTEQSIFIASTLIKLIWLRDGSRQQIVDMPSSTGI